jgi:hypothetical protein
VKLRMKKDLQQSQTGSAQAPGRRRFLAGVGAAGLTAATAVFGFASPALALVTVGCCSMYCPSSHSLTECRACTWHYIWTCTVKNASGKPVGSCTCCECEPTGNCNGTSWASADCT